MEESTLLHPELGGGEPGQQVGVRIKTCCTAPTEQLEEEEEDDDEEIEEKQRKSSSYGQNLPAK